jgi:transposase
MSKGIIHVGLDAHKDSIVAAVMYPRRKNVEVARFANEETEVRRFVRKLRKNAGGRVVACYEAGPTGFALKRLLDGLGVECHVIAPSLIPTKPGERVKTDRRDAVKLAGLLRADLLTEVHPPTPEEEAVRDLCRAREDAVRDATAAKHRLSKYLLRRGLKCNAKPWGVVWWKWLRSLELEHEADRLVLDSYKTAVEQAEERIVSLESSLQRVSETKPYEALVGRLRCFRGVDTVTAMTILTELHGFERFQSPRQLMAYLGLVPSEYSSGSSTKRGGITKAGNGHVRRALIEAAWHCRHRPGIGPRLRKRRKDQPPGAVAIADRAMRRLHKRWTAMVFRGKPTPVATTAVARELVGFVWATLMEAQTV